MIKRGDIDISTDAKFKNLTNGPSKLCKAMGIDTSLNGIDLCDNTVFIEEVDDTKDMEVIATKRVNIDYAEEYRNKPWRFLLKDNNFVSKPYISGL